MRRQCTLERFLLAAALWWFPVVAQADAIDVWAGTYEVGYNHGTGSLNLQQGLIDATAGIEGLTGTLTLRKGTVVDTTCNLRGPSVAKVRTDRVMLEGTCVRRGQNRWYYLFLVKAPGSFHGYYTAHATPPAALETVFGRLSFVTAIWGTGGPPAPETGTGGQPACPFVYAYDPAMRRFVEQGEILRNLLGQDRETLDVRALPRRFLADGKLVLSIREEKLEVSHIDYLAVQIGGRTVAPTGPTEEVSRLTERDGTYVTLRNGDELRLEFDLRGFDTGEPIQLLSVGYYTDDLP